MMKAAAFQAQVCHDDFHRPSEYSCRSATNAPNANNGDQSWRFLIVLSVSFQYENLIADKVV